MTVDPMARLATANPVPDLPAVEPPERLRRLIEDGAPESSLGVRRRRASGRVRKAALIALTAGCASLAGVLLTAGSSGPGVNVAAAAYAATSPQPGIVEAVFVARSYQGGGLATLRQQEWIDAATGRRRELNTLDAAGVHQVSDWMFAPGLVEQWRGGSQAGAVNVERIAGVVHVRHAASRRAATLDVLSAENIIRVEHVLANERIHFAFGGIALDGIESIELFRDLYRKGWIRLVGRERRGTELLWKLESNAIRPIRRPSGTGADSHTRLIVLVNPKTFLPVAERQVNVSVPGHPRVLVESNLVRYRRLPDDGAGQALFNLSAQHPRARVLVRQASFPDLARARHRAGSSAPHRLRKMAGKRP